MAWFAELAGKAESLLNNLDEQTGVALRSQSGTRKRTDRPEYNLQPENPPWNGKRRPALKTTRKPPQITETKANNGTKKVTPFSRLSRPQMKENNEIKEIKPRMAKSPGRKSINYLNTCPDTLVGDMKNMDSTDQFGLRHRRYSLPSDLDASHDSYPIKLQDLEVENAMLKNELTVMNREVSELLDRLRVTEDGNDVVSGEELHKINLKVENAEFFNSKEQFDKASLAGQLETLKQKVNNLTSVEIARYRDENQNLQLEVDMLRGRNKDLEDLIRETNETNSKHEETKIKIETELKHAQNNINELESNLEKTQAECRRLESEWDTYKLRVKTMLSNKDKEIKALQEGLNLTEDTKILIEQIEMLKEEREELSEAVSRVRGECADTRRHVQQLEARRDAAERAAAALRDALRDERDARARADAQCAARRKELKELESDTSHTINALRAMLREKEIEICQLREASVRSADTSALNVADYDLQNSIDHDKIHYLTQSLVQKQEKIDSLLADNNLLRIQMDKLESKYRAELSSLQRHSVVTVDDGRRGRLGEPALVGLSRRIGLLLKRYPIFRVFIMFYMVGLHFWVLTVLFTSTPDGVGTIKQKVIPNEA